MLAPAALVLWILFYIKFGAWKQDYPMSFRIQNGIFTLLLFIIGCVYSAGMMDFLIKRPARFYQNYYAPAGFIPAPVAYTCQLSFIFLSVFTVFLALLLLRRAELARRIILFIIPFNAILAPIAMVNSQVVHITMFAMILGDRTDLKSMFLSILAVATLVSLCFHLWMFLFYYRSTKARADAIQAAWARCQQEPAGIGK